MSLTSLIAPENLFLLILWIFLALIVVLALILVMHFLMPKRALQQYFKPPYFRPGECALFTGVPYSPIRTVMFMTVFAFPSAGKKRKLNDAYKMAPVWYRVASKILIFALVILGGATICMGIGYYVFIFIN